MKRSGMVLLSLILLIATPFALAEDRCGGGDTGPKPLSDMTDGFKIDTQNIPSAGAPEEFLFWEKSNKLVYRTELSEIYAGLVPTGQAEKLTNSGLPLSRIVDEKERYLVSESSPSIFDRKYKRWINYWLDARPFRHLFWNDDKLYSISARIDQHNKQYINVYEYEVGKFKAEPVCKTIIAEPGEHYTLAEGSAYPDVFFYRVKQGSIGKEISVFRMPLKGLLLPCTMLPLGQYTREIAGPVKSVHMFPELAALAVEVDHPKRNLLWDSSTGCRYFDIGRQKPLVLNYKKPLIATWSADDGMTLVHLDKEKKANVAWGEYQNVTELTQRDVWLADDGERLFVSPAFGYTSTRWLFKMTLSDPFGSK